MSWSERIMTGWTGARWLRLVFALLFLAAGIARHEPIAYFAALFFGAQAILNVGCCSTAGCSTEGSKTVADADDITYERIN